MKKLLHVHYSGIVRNKILLNYLIKKKKIKLKNDELFLDNYNDYDINKIKTLLNCKINRFKIIGNLWYNIIKNIYFFKDYNKLIIYEMNKQNINYIEFRIKLGSYFNPNNNKKISIENELKLFYKIKELYNKDNKDFKIICQISKFCNKEVVYNYFNKIINLINNNKKYLNLISGFDIVGDEEKGNELYYYKNIIIKLKKNMKYNIPFYFHAGEIYSNIKKSLNNIKFCLKYGGNRIGHGIYSIEDKNLLKQIKDRNILLEIAPLSNYYLGHIKNNYIYKKLYDYGINICINTDDPNKLNDSTLEDNEKFLLKHGFTQKDIDLIYCNTNRFIKINNNL